MSKAQIHRVIVEAATSGKAPGELDHSGSSSFSGFVLPCPGSYAFHRRLRQITPLDLFQPKLKPLSSPDYLAILYLNLNLCTHLESEILLKLGLWSLDSDCGNRKHCLVPSAPVQHPRASCSTQMPPLQLCSASAPGPGGAKSAFSFP